MQLTEKDNKVSVDDLLNEKKWPTPNWYSDKKVRQIRTYEEHFAFQLRSRYLELETDFRTILGNSPNKDIVTATRIADILCSAREHLEHGTIDLLTVSSSLDVVERNMIWLCPSWLTKARLAGILIRLKSMSFKERNLLIEKLECLSNSEHDGDYYNQVKSALDDTLGLINAEIVQNRIARGLQINRLRALRFWGVIVLLIFFFTAPLATNISKIANWPSQLLIGQGATFSSWINALAMMILGAVGGFLSGLLQARSTRVTMNEYLESMLRLQLRPLVGALVALVLYTILSWQVLIGITIENAGSYFLIAFLSGFSERYFLRLLKTQVEKSNNDAKELVTTKESSLGKGQLEGEKE